MYLNILSYSLLNDIIHIIYTCIMMRDPIKACVCLCVA